jgi:DNA adenine methylase
MDGMKITALAPWFGSKRTLAPEIVRELGPHQTYWEPFCGSMAVLLSKPACRMETVNDLHGDLINLARVVKDDRAGSLLYRRLRRTIMHEDMLRDAWAALAGSAKADAVDVDRAYAFFIVAWCGRNGTVGTTNNLRTSTLCVRWTNTGGAAATRFGGAVESIPQWRRRLRKVLILNRNAFDVLERIGDEDGASIYCDPPYLVKDAEYEHEFNDGFMAQANDHERLAAALGRFKRARVVVSYYEHPALAQLYPGWQRRLILVNKNLATAGGRGTKGRTAPEVLLINGKSLATTAA